MHEFTAKYADRIQGVLSGFDRLVFRGSLRKIAYPFGMSGYLWANQIHTDTPSCSSVFFHLALAVTRRIMVIPCDVLH